MVEREAEGSLAHRRPCGGWSRIGNETAMAVEQQGKKEKSVMARVR